MGLQQHRDTKFPISLQKCNWLSQQIHSIRLIHTSSILCCGMQEMVVLTQRHRKNPISELTQSTAESADCRTECEWAYSVNQPLSRDILISLSSMFMLWSLWKRCPQRFLLWSGGQWYFQSNIFRFDNRSRSLLSCCWPLTETRVVLATNQSMLINYHSVTRLG